MKYFAEPDYITVDREYHESISLQISEILCKYFGVVVDLINTSDSKYWDIDLAIITYLESKDSKFPSLSSTRKKMRSCHKAALNLFKMFNGVNYEEFHSVSCKKPEEIEDFHVAITMAIDVFGKKNNLDVHDYGLGIMHKDVERIIKILEIGLLDVLPPKPDNCHDEYPETYSPTDLLIRHLIGFYCTHKSGVDVEYMGCIPNLEETIGDDDLGTPAKPGIFTLFVQDVCKVLTPPISYNNTKLLLKKIKEVMKKIQSRKENLERQQKHV